MSEAPYSDDYLRNQLAESGDPDTFFVVGECIVSWDVNSKPSALVIEDDELAEALVSYLKRLGRVRHQL